MYIMGVTINKSESEHWVCVWSQSDLAVVATDAVRRTLSSRNQLTGGGVTAGVLTLLTNQITAARRHVSYMCDLKDNSE